MRDRAERLGELGAQLCKLLLIAGSPGGGAEVRPDVQGFDGLVVRVAGYIERAFQCAGQIGGGGGELHPLHRVRRSGEIVGGAGQF